MIEKNYLKTKPHCKVKFALTAEQLEGAKKVYLVGDFNDWDETATPMRKQKTGGYASTLNLDRDQHYQFRYLVDGHWLNDDAADSYQPSPVSPDHNCVVHI